MVASLGAALGVAATDGQAATEAGTPTTYPEPQIVKKPTKPVAAAPSASYARLASSPKR